MNRLLIFTLLNFLAVLSPGPDFAVVTRFGMTGSRKAALYATLGITAALFIHVTYSIFGVSVVLQQSPVIFSSVQLIGACYLLYIAIPMLFPGKSGGGKIEAAVAKKALMTGFWTNLLNPKATVLILSLFVQFLEPTDSLGLKLLFGLSVPCCALAWFSLYSYLLTHPAVVPFIQRAQRPITFCMGFLLAALSVFMIYSICKNI